MEGYTKLHSDIITSTVWSESHATRIVWITMLALGNQDGFVSASIPGLAKIAGVTISEAEQALSIFLAPDPYSRTKDNEGRRIAEVDGGWTLLNHAKHRARMSGEDRKSKASARQAAKRARDSDGVVASDRDASRSVTLRHAPSRPVTSERDMSQPSVTPCDKSRESRHTEAEAEAEAEATHTPNACVREASQSTVDQGANGPPRSGATSIRMDLAHLAPAGRRPLAATSVVGAKLDQLCDALGPTTVIDLCQKLCAVVGAGRESELSLPGLGPGETPWRGSYLFSGYFESIATELDRVVLDCHGELVEIAAPGDSLPAADGAAPTGWIYRADGSIRPADNPTGRITSAPRGWELRDDGRCWRAGA